jgi:hypothetical protein
MIQPNIFSIFDMEVDLSLDMELVDFECITYMYQKCICK